MPSIFPLGERLRLAPQLRPACVFFTRCFCSSLIRPRTRGFRVGALIPHTCVRAMANSLFVLQLVLPAPAERWLPPNITDKQAREAWFGFSASWREQLVISVFKKGLPTLTSPLIGQQLVAFLATALEAAHGISTHMITSPIVKTALINICEQKIIR